MPKIDSRLLDMTDPVAAENFNRTLKAISGAVESVVLNANAAGAIIGGTVTLANGDTIPITVATS